MFLIVYDDRGYVTNLPLEGRLTIQSDPLEIEYTVYLRNKLTRVSPLKPPFLENIKIYSKAHALHGAQLSSIDGLLMHQIGIIKLEVTKGVIYLQGRPLDSYLYDPESCSSAMPQFSGNYSLKN